MAVSEWLKTSQRWPSNAVESIILPCGRCSGCRLDKSRKWAIRVMHEAQMHEVNSFITLTFAPFTWVSNGIRAEGYPWFDTRQDSASTLRYVEFQRFMKRFKSRIRDHYGKKIAKLIRFYMAGEYGEQFGRPHFHACIFGFNFPDRVFVCRSPSGAAVYRSKMLEELWPFGYSSVGELTFESAAYVARYCMKKITGNAADDHYDFIDPASGDRIWRTPEFNKMSLKPGIGAPWLDKFRTDVYPHDHIIVRGKECAVPRYYDKLLERMYGEQFDRAIKLSNGQIIGYENVTLCDKMDEIRENRLRKAELSAHDNTPERLRAKEEVLQATLLRLKRKLT